MVRVLIRQIPILLEYSGTNAQYLAIAIFEPE